MSRIADNLKQIQQDLGSARLIVVSKYREIAEIQEAYKAGQRIFAENRVQPLLERKDALPEDIEWHLIGHLQSVDSAKLLHEIQKCAQAQSRTIDCLLQLHVAQEETKFGLTCEAFEAFLQTRIWESMPNIRICGCMAMASLTEDEDQIAMEFEQVHALFLKAKTEYFAEHPEFKELSIGMSSDFKIALEHGSTMVRIGSAIFQS
jgi:pyridoxal phosphate enzyme (YggS family)